MSFSPPFDAAHVGPRGQRQGHGHDSTFGSSPLFGMRIHHPRTSVPVLLESLPESPFSWKGAGTQPPAASGSGSGSVASSFSRPPLPASMGSSGSLQPTLETTAGDDKTEVRVSGVFHVLLLSCLLFPSSEAALLWCFHYREDSGQSIASFSGASVFGACGTSRDRGRIRLFFASFDAVRVVCRCFLNVSVRLRLTLLVAGLILS